jgi:hypothetical protein
MILKWGKLATCKNSFDETKANFDEHLFLSIHAELTFACSLKVSPCTGGSAQNGQQMNGQNL